MFTFICYNLQSFQAQEKFHPQILISAQMSVFIIKDFNMWVKKKSI